ncbi:hypothetical protein HYV56_01720 [Candidatus Peregrinibacteria bacterium]|nr:hypothetical protein [Candidatus Peregrinibacteria bacterium]
MTVSTKQNKEVSGLEREPSGESLREGFLKNTLLELENLGHDLETTGSFVDTTLHEIGTTFKNLPEDLTRGVEDNIRALQEALTQNQAEASKALVKRLKDFFLKRENAEDSIKEKKRLAVTYLVNLTDRNLSVLNEKVKNPFFGNLEAPAMINYKKTDGSLDYEGLQEQRALEGLPLFDKADEEEKPKIYEAISPQGAEKLILYWIPAKSDQKNFQGHWAIKGQDPALQAFIFHGWIVREIPKGIETVVRAKIDEEQEKRGDSAKIYEGLEREETRKPFIQAIANSTHETIQEETQTTDQNQAIERPVTIAIRNNFQYLTSLVESVEEGKTAEGSEKHGLAEPSSIERTSAISGESAENIPDDIEELSGNIVVNLLTKVRDVVGRKMFAPEEQKPQKEEIAESMSAIATLEEIFANMPAETISQLELVGESQQGSQIITQKDLLSEEIRIPRAQNSYISTLRKIETALTLEA